MNRSIWIFIFGIFCAVICSGCSSTAQKTAANCAVVLPENISLVSPYAGECVNGRAHGYGKVIVEKTYPKSGEKFIITYDGMFQHGQLTGTGKETEKFGNHSYEGTFYEWKRWTGTVHFTKSAKQKERQIYLRDGSVISHPVEVTQDPLYFSKASSTDLEGTLAQGVQVIRSLGFYGMNMSMTPGVDASLTSSMGCLVLQLQPDSLASQLGIERAGLIVTRYGHQNLETGCQDIDEINKSWKDDGVPGELQLTDRDGMIGSGVVSISEYRQAQMNLNSAPMDSASQKAKSDSKPREPLNAGSDLPNDVVCDQTPDQGMAPYAPDMCKDHRSGGQISRQFLKDNPRYECCGEISSHNY